MQHIQRHSVLSALTIGLIALFSPMLAAASCESKEADRPSIGLVLGGGGARGTAHIGVIKALEEMRVPIDCVVGTSMGSLVGALYASGMSVTEMEQTITGIDWDSLFNDATPREDQPYRRKRDDEIYALFGPKFGIDEEASLIPTGLISGQKINFLFESLVSQRVNTPYFDKLPLPYRAVAADLVTGEAVVIDQGNLALAMRASMSVPAVFDPVVWEDRLLVDGGIADNLPVDVAREMGADVVIAVDVGAGGLKKEQITSLLSVVGQLTNLMFMQNTNVQRASLTETDVLVKPALGTEISSADFAKSAQGVGIGYTSAMDQQADFSALTLTKADYARYVSSIKEQNPAPPVVEFVHLDNQSQFNDELILRQLHVEIGQPLDRIQLQQDIHLIYGLGFLELVRYEIVEDDGRRGLKLHVRDDVRGSRYLEWGLDLFSDDLTNGFNLRLGYLMTDLDSLGSELRIAGQIGREKLLVADLYKYIDQAAKTFVLPRLFGEVREITEFVVNEPVGIHNVSQYGGDIALGREFSRHAALSAGIRAYSGEVETLVGDPFTTTEKFDAGEYFADFTYDRLNDRYFPDDGNYARLQYFGAADWLGSDDDYGQVSATGLTAHTFGRHTLVAGIGVQATVEGEASPYALFSGGGLFRLSGYNRGQIAGQNFGIALASYQYRIVRSRLFPGRVGFSVEYGGVADEWEDLFQRAVVHGSLFAGFNTPIGPAYLGYGMGEGGVSRWFLKFGQVFGNPSVIR